ncbi:uncharacterized protein METZ01_LOCUS292762 [marine metagenome]|uniref:Uncharacterized protein n=1 Tax=marine metagenome TaxID=408172 RepID=A0A382LTC1_9ZZZZ
MQYFLLPKGPFDQLLTSIDHLLQLA